MGEEDISIAIENLRSKDLIRRLEGLHIISESGGKEKLPLILEALQDSSWHLRQEAVKAVVKIGEKAVPYLLQLLQEGVWFVRTASALALGEIGDPRALEILLVTSLDTNESVRKAAKEAMIKILEFAPSQRLSDTLHRCEPSCRKSLLEILSAVNPSKTEEVLSKKIEVNEKVDLKTVVNEPIASEMRKLRRILRELSR